jgi:hypothetical protein
MDQTNVQKRKAADPTEDTIAMQVLGESDLNSDASSYRYGHGLPSIDNLTY